MRLLYLWRLSHLLRRLRRTRRAYEAALADVEAFTRGGRWATCGKSQR